MFLFLYTHRHGKLIIFLAVLQTQALLFHDQLLLGWGGAGWGGKIKNVHVPTNKSIDENDDDGDDDEDDDDDEEEEEEKVNDYVLGM